MMTQHANLEPYLFFDELGGSGFGIGSVFSTVRSKILAEAVDED
jgi:hypothetical protein